MSDPSKRLTLKQAIEEAGNAWLLDYWGKDADRMLDQTAQDLDDFAVEYQRRFGDRPDPYTLLARDPHKARGFFQVDTFVASPEMKIAIWRILLGCEIKRVQFQYDMEGETALSITLGTPYGEDDPPYIGTPCRDFRVLRHLGATAVDGRLLLQGYYAFQQ